MAFITGSAEESIMYPGARTTMRIVISSTYLERDDLN